MAVQIFDRPGSGELAAGSFMGGLDQLLGKWDQKTQRKKQAKGFEALGVTKEQAKEIVNLPPKLQEIALNKLMDQQQAISAGASKHERARRYTQALMEQEQPKGKASGILAGLQPGEDIEDPLLQQEMQQAVETAGVQPRIDFQQAMQDPSFQAPGESLLQGLQAGEGISPQQVQAIQQAQTLGLLQPEVEQEPKDETTQLVEDFEAPNFAANLVNSYFGDDPLKEGERQMAPRIKEEKGVAEYAKGLEGLPAEDQMKIIDKRMKASHDFKKERMADHKDSDKFYKDAMLKYRSAKDDATRLDRMANLVKEGKLDPAERSSFLDMLDNMYLNLDVLRSPESQEFNKLSKEFIKGAKAIFGSRITDTDLKVFMKMIPTLSQTEDGKMRVINNLKAMTRGGILRKEVMDGIMVKNNGYRPIGFESQVESIVEPELDRLSKAFAKGYEEYKLEGREKDSIDGEIDTEGRSITSMLGAGVGAGVKFAAKELPGMAAIAPGEFISGLLGGSGISGSISRRSKELGNLRKINKSVLQMLGKK